MHVPNGAEPQVSHLAAWRLRAIKMSRNHDPCAPLHQLNLSSQPQREEYSALCDTGRGHQYAVVKEPLHGAHLFTNCLAPVPVVPAPLHHRSSNGGGGSMTDAKLGNGYLEV